MAMGTLDLVVNSVGGGTHIFRNDGHGHFKEDALGLNLQKGGMSLALGDMDGDGFWTFTWRIIGPQA